MMLRDLLFVLAAIPAILVAVVATKAVPMQQREITWLFVAIITWCCIISRYLFKTKKVASTLLLVVWLIGISVYVAAWMLRSSAGGTLSKLLMLLVMAAIFSDLVANESDGPRKVIKAVALTLVVIALIVLNIWQVDFGSEYLGHLLQTALVFSMIASGASYWVILRQQTLSERS